MLRNLHIGSYRQFEDVIVEDLEKINIIIGENNSGKTSMLEVIQLIEDKNVLGNLIRISRRRENIYMTLFNRGILSPYDCFINTFNKLKNYNKRILLEVQDYFYERYTIVIEGEEYSKLYIPEENSNKLNQMYFDSDLDSEIRVFSGYYDYKSPFNNSHSEFEFQEISSQNFLRRAVGKKTFNVNYVSPIEHYISGYSMRIVKDIIKSGNKHNIIELLQIFDENILGFETIGERGKTIIYLKHKFKGMVPLSIFGDGLKKVLTIASAIIKSKNGILLIDEIETAIHKKALSEIFSWFIRACNEYNVQVFLTTHSIEAVDALLEGVNQNIDDIACYRLEDYQGRIFVNRYSGQKLKKIRNNQGLDVR